LVVVLRTRRPSEVTAEGSLFMTTTLSTQLLTRQPCGDCTSAERSEMSHDGSWRASCRTTIHHLWFHFEAPSVARGVTDPSVGSGALFGSAGNVDQRSEENELRAEDSGTACSGFTDV
jgi:hypothetical protein